MLKSFALRTPLPDRKGVRWQPPTDVPAIKGRADSGDLELDLVELFTDVADLARDLGVGDRDLRRRDAGHLHRRAGRALRRLPRDQPAGRAAGRRRRRPAAPARRAGRQQVLRRAAVPVRRGRPAAARDGRPGAARAGRDRGRRPTPRRRSTSSTCSPTATPTSCRPTARSPGTPRSAARSSSPTCARRRRRPRASWPSASSAPATTGPRLPSGTTCARWPTWPPLNDDGAVTTSDIARALGRKPQSLSPARDGLIKKGLVYSGERGTVAFTVPHFGKFLRGQRG